MILRVSRKGIETRSVLLPPAPKHWLTPSLWQRPPLCTARYTYRHRHRLSYTTSFRQLHTQMCLEDMKGPHPKAAQPSCSLSLSFPQSALSPLHIFLAPPSLFLHLNLLFPAPQGRIYQSLLPAMLPFYPFLSFSSPASSLSRLKRYLSSLCTQSS